MRQIHSDILLRGGSPLREFICQNPEQREASGKCRQLPIQAAYCEG